ncbi:MAG: hypothetical protein ACI4DU_05830 [Lachnospiraceae bacterium]
MKKKLLRQLQIGSYYAILLGNETKRNAVKETGFMGGSREVVSEAESTTGRR